MIQPTESFAQRHIGPRDADVAAMLQSLGLASLDALIDAAIPAAIRLRRDLALDQPASESQTTNRLHQIASRNQTFRSMIGMGYSDCITPPVIQRNILENPGWYTQYTPYQAEISQGRLEALLNFQTMVADLTGLPLANASLLDEATAAAEAMAMCRAIAPHDRSSFFVSENCHPQTITVVQTRAKPMGIELIIGDESKHDWTSPSSQRLCGLLLQYPTTQGRVINYESFISRAHAAGTLVVVAADILALTLLNPPGELGADIAVGSTQRFGVLMGMGGPHAAYLSTKSDYARKIPGRLVGVSKDVHGNTAYRLAIQTREQHIRREKATSNICTAQVLPAILAAMYAVYHGPEGLRAIAQRIHEHAVILAQGLQRLGHDVGSDPFFDTLKISVSGLAHRGMGCSEETKQVIQSLYDKQINPRIYPDGSLGLSVDETTTLPDIQSTLEAFNTPKPLPFNIQDLAAATQPQLPPSLTRTTTFLTHEVFNSHHSETEMLRYIKRLESRDLSLATSMIALGSCTMKLNATTQMQPVTWAQFGRVHPFAPSSQTAGYSQIFSDLERWLAEITGFPAVSLQPNAGSQGEYAGLLAIRAYHQSRNQAHRTTCLIPVSAHGTNPASAAIAGLSVVTVACDDHGNIDLADLRAKAQQHKNDLAALMLTYPSTHGVFEEGVTEICKIIHDAGGQVYMDGANMNAQVGLCRPADFGADVCHLNLHKTFCIPHGGGGPGMGPIAVAQHLAPFLPGHPLQSQQTSNSPVGPVSAAPYGSPAVLVIPWAYIALMGAPGLKKATQVAILSANYMAKRLQDHYSVLFVGANGRVAHEFILDCRSFEQSAGIKVEDIAKRLMDYGFHAPTMSFPVPGTLMIEPTESEPKEELDRFCDALIAIRNEIRDVEQGLAHRTDNPLKNAPHTAQAVSSDNWTHPYPRSQAAYPLPWLKHYKFWPAVGRIDNPYGDRNLVCSCPPSSQYES